MNIVRLKPRLIAVAGPNGAGKTSTTEQLLRHEWMGDSVYVNPAINAKCLRLRIMKGGTMRSQKFARSMRVGTPSRYETIS